MLKSTSWSPSVTWKSWADCEIF